MEDDFPHVKINELLDDFDKLKLDDDPFNKSDSEEEEDGQDDGAIHEDSKEDDEEEKKGGWVSNLIKVLINL